VEGAEGAEGTIGSVVEGGEETKVDHNQSIQDAMAV